MQHAISVKQFTDPKLLHSLFTRADELQAMAPADYPKPLQHRTIATIFYEPSTRTRLSFETAVQNLGGHIITAENAAEFSSAIKGETIEDTVRVVQSFADGIVLRHPEIGTAARAVAVSNIPVISGGDGIGEHPTQALLDMYTIFREFGSFDGLEVGLVGDLKNGRTIHALIPLLCLYKIKLYLIAPAALKLQAEYIETIKQADIPYQELDDWDSVLSKLDVLYMTRVQKERFSSQDEYAAVKDSFILTKKMVETMKPKAAILHPLPRVNEIEPAVDDDPRARYFQQVKNGLFLRMALLEYLYS